MSSNAHARSVVLVGNSTATPHRERCCDRSDEGRTAGGAACRASGAGVSGRRGALPRSPTPTSSPADGGLVSRASVSSPDGRPARDLARRVNCAFEMNWDEEDGYAADGVAVRGKARPRGPETARSAIDGRRHLHPGIRLSGCRSAVLRPRVAAAARFLREAADGFRARLVAPRLNSTRSVERVSE